MPDILLRLTDEQHLTLLDACAEHGVSKQVLLRSIIDTWDGTCTINTNPRVKTATHPGKTRFKGALYLPEIDALTRRFRYNYHDALITKRVAGTAAQTLGKPQNPPAYKAMWRYPWGDGQGQFVMHKAVLMQEFYDDFNDDGALTPPEFVGDPAFAPYPLPARYSQADISPVYDYRYTGCKTQYVRGLSNLRTFLHGSASVSTFELDEKLTDEVKTATLNHYDSLERRGLHGHRPFSRDDLERAMELIQESPYLPLYEWYYEPDPSNRYRNVLVLSEKDPETAKEMERQTIAALTYGTTFSSDSSASLTTREWGSA